jgi:hypothetical protein
MKIYLIAPFTSQYQDVYNAISNAVSKAGATLTHFDSAGKSNQEFRSVIIEEMEQADVVFADLSTSGARANVFYELGMATSMNKPCIVLCEQETRIPVDMHTYKVVLYDRSRLNETLAPSILNLLLQKDALKFFKEPLTGQLTPNKQMAIFISYSHTDSEYLNRLHVHLKPFEKSGQVELWSDTKINAGDKWKTKIEQALSKAAIAILLISADFLASDFIVDNELPPLLRAAEEKGTFILPVIIKPCRFTSHESLSVFQAINDPKSLLSKMSENDREEVYVKIADRVDNLL